jgi:UPF0755 protein
MDGFKRPARSGAPVNRPIIAPPRTTQSQSQNAKPSSLPPVAPSESKPASTPANTNAPIDMALGEEGRAVRVGRWHSSKRLLLILGAVLGSLIAALIGMIIWYRTQLGPVNPADHRVQRVEVKEGTAFTYIATRLKERGLIRNTLAFDIQARLTGKRSAVQAGTCSLTPSESSAEILDKLTSGCHDFKSLTFFPGATIEKPLYKFPGSTLDQDSMYIKAVLANAGYSEQEISSALGKTYGSPLFAGKPENSSLEGYIFGETYFVATDASAETVLKTAFAHMYSVVQKNDLIAKYQAHGLNLYQGITLASIVESELDCEDKSTPERKDRCYQYQRTIAQIFLKRLKENISLGSDVTFIYAANLAHVAPSVSIDSPYNTRKHPGLPPGPISSPGELALKAVANPADTDYLFFIAGDDGLIYFAKTDAEHQQNIKKHCQKLCGEL